MENDKLSWSEFKLSMEQHSCPNCPIGVKGPSRCEDLCIDCYIDFLKDYTKTKSERLGGKNEMSKE